MWVYDVATLYFLEVNAAAIVGARFAVTGRFGAYQKQGNQRAEDSQRSASVERRPEALN